MAACADTWAEAGEALGAPIGSPPTVGAQLARLATVPDLVLSDGEVLLMAEFRVLGVKGGG